MIQIPQELEAASLKIERTGGVSSWIINTENLFKISLSVWFIYETKTFFLQSTM